MDLLVNELSIHEQFHDVNDMGNAFLQLVKMRSVARGYKREIKCTQHIYSCKPNPDVELLRAINQIPEQNLKRAILSWLTGHGPFWDDTPEHSANDYLDYEGEIVTETAVGEAAFRNLNDRNCGLISVAPSDWTINPVHVCWRRQDVDPVITQVGNWWDPQELDHELERWRLPLTSWEGLKDFCISQFTGLTFFEESFTPLIKLPFSKSATRRIQDLLRVLNSISQEYDAQGNRTKEGHGIYHDFFTGNKGWFSDSSDTEKRKFREELQFTDRELQIYKRSCPWHGKINNYTMPLRIHFSWPSKGSGSLCVAYIGPKLTMH